MENDIISLIKQKAEECCNSLYKYAAFISDMEFFADQYPEFFGSNELYSKYHHIWFELEILNACVLNDWEENGKPNNFDDIWNTKYRTDAVELIHEFTDFLNYLNTK